MKHIAAGTVIDYHDLTEVWLDAGDVFDVIAAAKGAVLAIIAAGEILAVLLEPVDHGVGIFLHRGGEGDKGVPFAYLETC